MMNEKTAGARWRTLGHSLKWITVGLCLAAVCTAQTVQPVFVAPEDTIDDNFTDGLSWAALPDGYKAVVVNAGNQAIFERVAPDELVRIRREVTAGPLHDFLRQMSREVSGDRSDSFLFLTDDRTGIGESTGSFSSRAEGDDDAPNYVWPNASATWDAGGRVRGRIRVGQHYAAEKAADPGWVKVQSTIVHEYLHTQFAPEAYCSGSYGFCLRDSDCPTGESCRSRKTKWGSSRITYGADGHHWVYELIGGQNLAFEEGLGNFYGFVFGGDGEDGVEAFFERTDERYFLEARSVLRSQLGLEEATRSSRDGRYYYTWRNTPGRALLFCELTTTGYYYYYWKYANGDRNRALQQINASASAMWRIRRKRDPTYAANRLALELESAAGGGEGGAAATSSMFPYALLDLLTHFGMTAEEYRGDHDRNYPDRNPAAYERYFSNRDALRDAVRAHLEASPVRMDEAIEATLAFLRRVEGP